MKLNFNFLKSSSLKSINSRDTMQGQFRPEILFFCDFSSKTLANLIGFFANCKFKNT